VAELGLRRSELERLETPKTAERVGRSDERDSSTNVPLRWPVVVGGSLYNVFDSRNSHPVGVANVR